MLEKHEKAARTRKFGSPTMNKGLALFCFLFTVYHLVIASGMVSIQNLKHHAIHVGLILILSFVLYPAWEKASRKKNRLVRLHLYRYCHRRTYLCVP